MPAATEPINTPERPGVVVSVPVAAGARLFAGALAALDATGHAVPAADAPGLRVLGRVEESADNTGGAAGEIAVPIKRGVFRYPNSATAPLDAGAPGRLCYVEDDQTVAQNTTHRVVAGRVVAVEEAGVWVEIGSILPAAAPALASSDGTAAAAADLAALAAEAEKIGDDVRALHAALFG